jgi:hypothetical protein
VRKLYVLLLVCSVFFIPTISGSEVGASKQISDNDLLNSLREMYYKNNWQKKDIALLISMNRLHI